MQERTLARFWHWYDNEKPPLSMGAGMLDGNVDALGRVALTLAMAEVAKLAKPRNDCDWVQLMPALRDLSLAFARGLEGLRDSVPLDWCRMTNRPALPCNWAEECRERGWLLGEP